VKDAFKDGYIPIENALIEITILGLMNALRIDSIAI
jgi:hypothetical protein